MGEIKKSVRHFLFDIKILIRKIISTCLASQGKWHFHPKNCLYCKFLFKLKKYLNFNQEKFVWVTLCLYIIIAKNYIKVAHETYIIIINNLIIILLIIKNYIIIKFLGHS